MPVFDSKGEMLSIGQLKNEMMKYVVPESENSDPHPVAVVSSDERGIWADVYARLKGTVSIWVN